MNKKIEIYTDGSSLEILALEDGELLLWKTKKQYLNLVVFDKNTTNNRMEIKAVIEALKYINKNYKGKSCYSCRFELRSFGYNRMDS